MEQDGQWSTGKRYFDMTAYCAVAHDSGGRLRTDHLKIGLCQKGKVSETFRTLSGNQLLLESSRAHPPVRPHPIISLNSVLTSTVNQSSYQFLDICTVWTVYSNMGTQTTRRQIFMLLSPSSGARASPG